MQIKSEMLIRRVDKTCPDPIKNAQLTKRGDVIVVKPAGWQWTQKELDNPEWLIVHSDMDLIDAEAFLLPEVGFLEQGKANQLKRKRAKCIDLDQAALDLPDVAPEQAHKAIDNFATPFQFSKELIASYARFKA